MQKFDPNFEDFLKVEPNEPNLEEFKKDYGAVIEKLKNAKTAEEAIAAIRESFVLDESLSTQYGLVYVHHTIDTRDEKYTRYSEIFDEILPYINDLGQQINKLIIESPFIKEIKKEFSPLFIKQIKLSLKTFDPKVIPLLQKENSLVAKYVKLLGSAVIEYKGEKYSLSQMGKFTTHKTRLIRKEANEIVLSWWEEHEKEVGDIFDELVHVRDEIAQQLGYRNFIQLAYDRLGRTGWNAKDIQNYREQVKENIVPLAVKVLSDQKERLGYGDDTQFYDYNIFYKSGNPTPKGNKDKLVDQARKLYHRLNKECSHYFDFMIDHNCVDLEAKQGKSGGGYMEYFPALKTSFIFSNFNGTDGDVDVLTHEFGHALQGFLAGKTIDVPSLRSPGMECCEMHSMSMEFLTYPYMELFFKKDADKYRYKHLADAITFIPYGTMVDEFQHIVYKKPNMTPEQRNKEWLKLEKVYRPMMDYKNQKFLKDGCWWMRQHHIIENPFYYIDYTIAQVVALEFFIESQEELKEKEGSKKANKTMRKYLKFCKTGGKKVYKQLLRSCKIDDPMVPPTQKEVATKVMDVLNSYNVEELDK